MGSLVIGLTSGIAAGKDTVVDLFAHYGIDSVDADKISHHLTKPGTPLAEQILSHFGEAYRNPDGSINRQALRDRIFNNSTERIRLEKLLHPSIRRELLKQLEQCTGPYVLLVAPLLIEASLHKLCDKTIVISTDEKIQIDRVCARDNISEQQARKILAAQMPLSEKMQHADYIIENNGTKEELMEQVAQLHQTLLAHAKLNNQATNAS